MSLGNKFTFMCLLCLLLYKIEREREHIVKIRDTERERQEREWGNMENRGLLYLPVRVRDKDVTFPVD